MSTEPDTTEEQQVADCTSRLAINGENEVTKAPQNATSEQPEALPSAKPAQKYKYDWYQTESEVRINVLIKKVKQENVRVNFHENAVDLYIKVGEGDEFSLNLSLAHGINPNKCAVKVYATKVELRMKKIEGLHWESLEKREAEGPVIKQPKDIQSGKTESESDDIVHKYPSSSHYTRDWDKLAAEVKEEEKNEKPEGDAALNKLFQQIYEGGSDEVKKAMNKSFMESGGTVLSTNWSEIGSKKVDRQTPQGMEWKQYEKHKL